MRSIGRFIATCLPLVAVTLASPAAAEDNDSATVREGERGDLTYEFYDDPLAAGGIAPSGGGITVVNRHVRTLLIRPRTQFIVQMLKSVEDL